MPKQKLTAAERATAESAGYVWFDTPKGTWVLAQSGNSYKVGHDTCECIWFQIHHAPCKHIEANRKRAAMTAEKDTRQ